MDEEQREAVAELVNYNWAKEEEDANENGMMDDSRHIFSRLELLQKWLEGNAMPTEAREREYGGFFESLSDHLHTTPSDAKSDYKATLTRVSDHGHYWEQRGRSAEADAARLLEELRWFWTCTGDPEWFDDDDRARIRTALGDNKGGK
jgi:hypothetical protein